jgi:hypothetical protein
MTQTLNQGQRDAADAFYDFLFDDSRIEFIISGAAGVGKTFLMRHIIDVVLPRYHASCELLGIRPDYLDVEMTATTNKAAEVLTLATGRPCSTVHSFFGLRVYDDDTTGETKLTRSQDAPIHRGKVIFVDECSMIDTLLRTMVLEGIEGCKLVYVGDHCQMAPINEPLSPIYRQGAPFVRLTQPVRNAGQPALVALCAQLRRTVEEGVWAPIREVPGVIDVLDNAGMKRELEAQFRGPNPEARVLGFTNEWVIACLGHIRRQVRALPDVFTAGEELVVNQAYVKGQDILNVEQAVQVLEVLSERQMHIEGEVYLKLGRLRVTGRTKSTGLRKEITVEYPLDRRHYRKLKDHFAEQKKWRMFFQLKNEIADLRPAEACTVYKAQGSTYDTVYVNLEDLATCENPGQLARMLYVAVSRARTRVCLYEGKAELAHRYGGRVIREPGEEDVERVDTCAA